MTEHPPALAAVGVPAAPAPLPSHTTRQKNLAVVLLVLAGMSAVFNVLLYCTYLPRGLAGRNDFLAFYAAGVLVNEGSLRQLYDEGLQYNTQKRIAPDAVAVRGGVYYFHPPLELAFFAPLARLPYRTAYAVTTAANLAILVVVIVLLPIAFPSLKQLFGPFVFLLLLGFWPVYVAVYQTQISPLLLLLFLLAVRDIQAGRIFRAGCLLGLTVVKFQYVVPLAALALLTGRKRLFAGIATTASLCGLASLAAVGWRGLWMELAMILQLNRGVTDAAVQVQNKIFPTAMLNLRALLYLVLSRVVPERAIVAIVLLASVALFFWTAAKIRHLDELTWFALATLTSLAISYHCYIQDGVLYLLPLFILLVTRYRDSIWPLLATLPFVVPALAWPVLFAREVLLAVASMTLLFVTLLTIRRTQPFAQTTAVGS